MSYEFTKLSDVPVVAEFPEGANAVIETNGEIKRCPSSGGGGGVELITLTKEGETFTASKNSEEIIALINSGKLPILIVPPGAVSATLGTSAGLYMFPTMTDGAEMAGKAGFVFGAINIGFAIVDSAGTVTLMFGP